MKEASSFWSLQYGTVPVRYQIVNFHKPKIINLKFECWVWMLNGHYCTYVDNKIENLSIDKLFYLEKWFAVTYVRMYVCTYVRTLVRSYENINAILLCSIPFFIVQISVQLRRLFRFFWARSRLYFQIHFRNKIKKI